MVIGHVPELARLQVLLRGLQDQPSYGNATGRADIPRLLVVIVAIKLDSANSADEFLIIRDIRFRQGGLAPRNFLFEGAHFILQVDDVGARDRLLLRRIEKLAVSTAALARATFRQPRIATRFPLHHAHL